MTVTAVLPPLADDDLGTDVRIMTDLAPVWGLVSDFENLGMAMYRRLTCPRGRLFYDPGYGYDVRDLLNAKINAAVLAFAQSQIVAQGLADERIQHVDVDMQFDARRKTLTIAIQYETALGPFDLVLRATQVTVDILRLAGRDIEPAVAPPDAVVVQVAGPQGPPGIPGGGGGGGTGASTFEESAEKSVSAGDEEVVAQFAVDCGLFGGSITGQLTADVFSASGTSTFRLRLGGSDGLADGTVVATLTRSGASYALAAQTGTLSNPTGVRFLKITAQNATVGQAAKIKDATITLS